MIIGYVFTAVYTIFLAVLIGSAILSRDEIKKVFKGKVDRLTLTIAMLIFVSFIAISLLYVHPVEQLYFDENIYQGISLNILHNGNALWCQYGSAYTVQCPISQIYHDPVEWSFYLAIAFLFFGPGASTAYALQLLIGAVAILLTFLLGSLLLGKRGGLASAFIIALIPEIFIWSRTQATPDLGFMTFSILAFLCYVIYDRTRTEKTLALFLAALGIAVYVRIEAALLIPIFILIYFFAEGTGPFATKMKFAIYSKVTTKALLLFLFFICIIPQIYYITYELNGLDYGTGTICNTASNHTFSVGNFLCNAPPNIYYFLGQYNYLSYYPAYFSIITTVIAIIGLLALLILRRQDKLKILLILGLWILAYYLFYDFFYAGSVTYGVDVRFMLQLYPAIAILAAAGIDEFTNIAGYVARSLTKVKGKTSMPIFFAAIFIILIFVFAVYPFLAAFKEISVLPQNMPQEPGPLSAVNFIYANYNSVPTSCLVFSFTPDVWYELNRSSAQIGYLGSSDPNFTIFASHYSCYVIDYGYWCVVPPYHASTCSADITNYNVSKIVSSPSSQVGSGNPTLYRINNYVNR